jgi:N-acetyl sugar amidotransferase
LKICKECIQPDTRPGIYFDDNGICGGCLWEKEKKEIDWDARKKELELISQHAISSKTGIYDCAIGVSGGKDSTFQAITARDKLGLSCLLVNCQPENITEIGKQNIENLKNLGFDVITIRSNPKIMKKLVKYDFIKNLNPVKATEFPLYSSTYIIAEKFQIPLIIQGENPGLTLGTRLTGVGTDYNALKANELQTLSSGWEIYLDVEGVTEKDLFWFHYDRKKLESFNTKAIWLNYFLPEWSQKSNAKFSKRLGLKWRDENFDPNSIGTYSPYFQLDTNLTQVNQMLKFIKFGFGQCMDHVCYDIRDGHISRNDAIDLVLKYDGKCSVEYVHELCEYMGITVDFFWDVVEEFRGDVWYGENGNWKNKIWDELEKTKSKL